MATTMADLLKAATSAPIAAATAVPVLPAGSYLAGKPRFQLIVSRHGTESKRAGKPMGRLDLHFEVNDPLLEELDLPVTSLRCQDLITTWGTGAATLDFQSVLDVEQGINIPIGLDPSKNVNFSRVMGMFAFAWGLAEGSMEAPVFPPDGELIKAYYYSDHYTKALASVLGTEEQRGEMMLDAKGKAIEEEDMYPLILAQHQIVAVQSLFTAYNKKTPLQLKANLALKYDDFQKMEVNVVNSLFLLVGETEHRLI